MACQMSGWPVAMQSLLDGIDLEDLGMHCMDKTMQEHKDISLPKDMAFPQWLKDYCKVIVSRCKECCSVQQHDDVVVMLSQKHLQNSSSNAVPA